MRSRARARVCVCVYARIFFYICLTLLFYFIFIIQPDNFVEIYRGSVGNGDQETQNRTDSIYTKDV